MSNVLMVYSPVKVGTKFALSFHMRIPSLLGLLPLLLGCVGPSASQDSDLVFIEREGLPQLLQLSESVFTGGQPVGPGFLALSELGVQTLVNVDGAQPNLAAARAAGLTYFHIPLDYGGISTEAARSLERLAKEAGGPFYIHCHHGKHRGPAAAALVMQALGEGDFNRAHRALRTASTSLDYPGLWESVENWKPAPSGSPFPELVAAASVDGFQSGMAQIDRIWDRVKLIRAANWKAPERHPDLSPERETQIFREALFLCFQETEEPMVKDPQFNSVALKAISFSRNLQAGVTQGDFDLAESSFQGAKQSCKSCHRSYRE
ncbi:MAG TPA: sulfur transferase domain-containing protein [Planctomycetota bacterium]|nr:sulfur transferase domain-containing protein [Planctomycetota bacterium]HJM39901.1 sulfur transferase domain-containing protein [Planctomycetota bacterium]|tara:strand:- start:3620 stop:4579 length:960 start_codon:yes stop_codon:yes gene_type:complete